MFEKSARGGRYWGAGDGNSVVVGGVRGAKILFF
jgi:hypothetical protein